MEIKEKNVKAFLDVIAKSEGTFGKGDNGYNMCVGRTFFADYSEHPNPHVYIASIKDYSSAAGRYQLLFRYWKIYRETLKLDNCEGGAFGKIAQDKVAIEQIKERHALKDVESGNFDEAIKKVANCWASLPGGCQHHEDNTMSFLRTAFLVSGGTLNQA